MATTPRHSRCCRRPLRTSKVHRKTETVTSEPQQCVICLDTISSRGKLGVCDHAFCYVCIFEWSKNSNTCPLCKQRFRCITKVSLAPGGTPDRQVFVSDKDQREWYEEDFVDSEGFSTAEVFENLNEYDLEDSFIDDSDASYRYDGAETTQLADEYTPPSSPSSHYELRTRHHTAAAASDIPTSHSSGYELRNGRERSPTSSVRNRQQERRVLRARRALSSLSNTSSDTSTSQERLTPSSDSSDIGTQHEREALLSSTDSSMYQDQTTSPSSEERTSSGFSSFSSESSPIFADYEVEDEFRLNCGTSRRKHKVLKFDSDTEDDDDADFITVHHAATRRGMRQLNAILLTSEEESETELEQDYITRCDKIPAAMKDCQKLVRRELHSPRYSQSSMSQYLTSTRRRRQVSPAGPSKPVISDGDITQFTSDEDENFTTRPMTGRRGVATRSHTHQSSRYPQVSMTTSTAGVWLTARGKRAEHRAATSRRGQKRTRREQLYQSRHHDNSSSDDSDWNPFEI